MPTRLFALVLLVLICLPAPTSAEPILVMVDMANPPFMYATTDQKAAGVYPAIISEAFSRMGVPVQISAIPWKRALAEMESGRGGVGGIYMTAPRLEKYDYSDEIFVENLQLVVLASRTFQYAGLESLRGRNVGVLLGWSYGDAFDKARAAGVFRVEEVESDAQNLAKLQTERIDVMIATREGANESIAVSKSPPDFVILDPPLTVTPTYLAFSKQMDKRELLRSFNNALASMRQDGTWDKIVMAISARK